MSDRKEFFLRHLSWAVPLAYLGLFFSIPISNVALILMLLICLLSLSFSDAIDTIRSNRPIQLLILFYLLHLPGLLYTENMPNGTFVLEKKVTLLVFPILLCPALQKLTAEEMSKIALRIGIITIASSVFYFEVAGAKVLLAHNEMAFHRDYFTSIPYVFYAIYFSTGSLLLFNWLYGRWKNPVTNALVLLALIAYSLGVLVIVASKAGLIAYVAGLTYLLYVRIPSRRIFGASLAAVILAVAIFLYARPVTLNRFLELRNNFDVLNTEKLVNFEEFNGLNLRLYFWKVSLSELWNEGRVVGGVGTGDAQDFLNQAYRRHNLDIFGYLGYDPHNQWIMTLLQLGVAGVIVLGALFISAWLQAERRHSIELKIFLWIILCFSLSESVLESNKGIVFFGLFFCFLMSYRHPSGIAAGTQAGAI